MDSCEDLNQHERPTDSGPESSSVGDAAAPSSAADAPPSVVESAAPATPHDEKTSKADSAAKPDAGASKDARVVALPNTEADRSIVSLNLIPFTPLPRAEAAKPFGGSYWRAAFERRYQIGAMAAGLAMVGIFAAAALSYWDQQNQSLVAQTSEAQTLADTVKALKARLGALEAARREDTADLRKSVAELKIGLSAAHDSSAVLAQFNARADRLEHESEARIEKLGERVDHDAAAHNADFAARLEKLEKKAAAPAVAALAAPPSPAAVMNSNAVLAQFNARADRIDHDAATHNADFAARLEKLEKKVAAPAVAALTAPPTPPAPAAVLTRQPTASPPVATNVSKETTGSIPTPRGAIHGWTVREVHGGVAIVEGPYGFRQIQPGDTLAGAGHVERIERRESGWAVVTDQGVINGQYGVGTFRVGPFGEGGFGPPEGEF
jgi:hypothetical protein